MHPDDEGQGQVLESDPFEDSIPLRWRAYMYRVAVAAIPVLTGYGVVSESQAALWLGLLGTVLAVSGFTMASSHTSTKRK
jgi:hypothetical protein